MLKTYRIIPLVFILFLFGFTLITVSPVIAEDSSEFVACQQIKPGGDFQLLQEKKNCFRDVARALLLHIAENPPEKKGVFGISSLDLCNASMKREAEKCRVAESEVVQLNGRIAELQKEIKYLTKHNKALKIQNSDVFTKYLDREAEHSKALETVDELRVKHKDAEDRMIARNAELRHHNCSRASHKIHSANPALSGFGNGFMRIIGAPMHCDGYWRD